MLRIGFAQGVKSQVRTRTDLFVRNFGTVRKYDEWGYCVGLSPEYSEPKIHDQKVSVRVIFCVFCFCVCLSAMKI